MSTRANAQQKAMLAWASPALIAIIGLLGTYNINGILNTLANLTKGQTDMNERLVKIETTLLDNKDATNIARTHGELNEAKIQDLDRRLTKIEAHTR